MMQDVSAVIVSHNSDRVLPHCLDALAQQSVAVREVIIVDCASDDRETLLSIGAKEGAKVVETRNVGFSRANNLGMESVSPQADFVVFLNPDTFLSPDFVEAALEICLENPQVGMVSGKLLGYDIKQNAPTGRLDSTGIFRQWYGRWVDRGQSEQDRGQYNTPALVPALCGALLFCRVTALQALQGPVFDPDFFLYKEDVELSLRMKKAGWELLYHPRLIAYHCRGWNEKRGSIPLELRCMAAANEIVLYKKHPSPYIIWAWLKYLLVRFIHL
ncbi:MAG: glycosyltransferase family 2 protein [Pseudomonadota bacterium]